MGDTFMTPGRPGYLEPFVAHDRGLVVKGYRVSGWRSVVAKWLITREDRAQAAMARIGVAPMPVSSSGLLDGEAHVGFAMVRLSGVHPSRPMATATEDLLHQALRAIHKAGWTHNDLHASNVLIEQTAQGSVVWVLDWTKATRFPWPLSAALRVRDRRHMEKIIARAQGRPYGRPLFSRLWGRVQSCRRRAD